MNPHKVTVVHISGRESAFFFKAEDTARRCFESYAKSALDLKQKTGCDVLITTNSVRVTWNSPAGIISWNAAIWPLATDDHLWP